MHALTQKSLARYVPAHTLRRVAMDPRPHAGVEVDRLTAAVLFADISGFTALTERLAAGVGRGGAVGAEAIHECLDAYLGAMVTAVTELGGDVVKFAGDALIAVWPTREGDLGEATRQAAQCALAVRDRFGSWPVPRGLLGDQAGDDERLTVRLCVCAGDLLMTQLGGVLDRWEPLVLGAPLRTLSELKSMTKPGEVVLAGAARALAPSVFRGTALPAGHLILSEVVPALASRTSPRSIAELDLVAPDAVASALRSYLPGVVLTRLSAGQDEWLGELRRVSVLFVAVPSAEDASDAGILHAQEVVEAIQKLVYRVDGSINKIAVDEKGAVLVAAFGLPPLSHEDDAYRAVKTALAIATLLPQLGEHVRVGVATGTVFCGTVGSAERAEYTMIGGAVNLAARFMEMSDGNVLCDEVTWLATRGQLGFLELPPVALKGHSALVSVFSPTGETKLQVRPRTAMVGRDAERSVVSEAIQSLLRRQDSAGVIILGEPGVGKSRLVDSAIEQARRLGARVLIGGGDSIDRATPYRAWRSVFGSLFQLDELDLEARAAQVREKLGSDPELGELIPLLDAVLPLPLPDSPLTRQMRGEARANKTRELLSRLIASAAADVPTLIVLEDAHWFDTQSWSLLAQIAAEVRPLALVVSSRPLDKPPAQFAEIEALTTTSVVRLQGLDFDETRTLIRQRLAVRDIPDEVARLVFDRGAGNALFTEELALALRDLGHVHIDGDTARLAVSQAELQISALPDTVKGVVTARVDRLNPASQLLLKVASVIGRTFDVDVLSDVFFAVGGSESAASLLGPLHALDLVRPAPSEGGVSSEATLIPNPVGEGRGQGRYIFKHALTQDAIYELMLVTQRRDLHRAVATWLERAGRGEEPAAWSVLAHHWEHAQDRVRAVHYLERAGAHALSSFANQEAVRALERALAIATPEIRADESRVAEWRLQLAEGQFRQGDLESCRQHGREALAKLGRPLPRTTFGRVLSLFGQIGLRMFQRWWPARFASQDSDDRLRRLAATRVLNRITEVCIYGEDALGCLDSGLRELNTSEPAGPSAELGRAYAAMAMVLGSIPLRGICEAWTARALAVVEASDSPGGLAYVLSRVAVYDLYVARWREGEERLRRAISIADRLGDLRLREEAMAILAKTLFYSGDFDASVRLWAEVRVSARKSGSAQTAAWSLFGQGEALLRLRRATEALPLLEASRAWAASKAMASEVVWLEGLRALALLRTGARAEAKAVALKVLPKVAGVRPVAYWTQQSTAALAEVFCDLGRTDKALLVPAQKTVKAVRAFAGTFPFGGAQAELWSGVLLAVQGRPELARAAFQRCQQASDRIGTRYESARAALEIARLESVHSRPAALANARALLDPLGAGWEADEA